MLGVDVDEEGIGWLVARWMVAGLEVCRGVLISLDGSFRLLLDVLVFRDSSVIPATPSNPPRGRGGKRSQINLFKVVLKSLKL